MSTLLSNFSSTPFAFGGAAISEDGGGYGFGKCKEHPSDLLMHAFDRGVRVFDSAPIYGFGRSEEVMGKTFKQMREKVFLVSKSGVYWHKNKRVDMTNDPKVTAKMLDDSLKRFDSDYIDLYMIHWPDQNVDIRYPMEVLAKAKSEGKIKHIGLCNSFENDFKVASSIDDIEVLQSEFSIFNTQAKDWTSGLEKKCSFMSWGTFDKGILTGRVDKKREQAKKYDAADCRKSAPWWQQSVVIEKANKFKEIKKIWEREELTPVSGALSFNLSHDFLDTILIGAKSIKDWDEILETKIKRLSSNTLKELYEFS